MAKYPGTVTWGDQVTIGGQAYTLERRHGDNLDSCMVLTRAESAAAEAALEDGDMVRVDTGQCIAWFMALLSEGCLLRIWSAGHFAPTGKVHAATGLRILRSSTTGLECVLLRNGPHSPAAAEQLLRSEAEHHGPRLLAQLAALHQAVLDAAGADAATARNPLGQALRDTAQLLATARPW